MEFLAVTFLRFKMEFLRRRKNLKIHLKRSTELMLVLPSPGLIPWLLNHPLSLASCAAVLAFLF